MKTANRKQEFRYSNDRPIVAYNSEVPEWFAILKNQDCVVKYLWRMAGDNRGSNVTQALATKRKLCNTVFDFKVSLRYAKPEHINLLGNKTFHVKDGYFVPDESLFFKGF